MIADFHPLKNNFRLSVGYLRNRNKVDLVAVPTDDVTIGDTVYAPAQVGTLNGAIRFEDNTPYFGIGYGNGAMAGHRVRFLRDVGVVQQGAGSASLTSTGVVAPADLQIEEADVEDQIKNYKFWPIISMGLSIRI